MTKKFRMGEIVRANKSLYNRFPDSALICRNIDKMGIIKHKYKNPHNKRFLYEIDFNQYQTYHFIFFTKEISHVSKIKKDEFIAEMVAKKL
jgi:hypothetical protein